MISDVQKEWLAVAPEWILEGPVWLSNFCYDFFKNLVFQERYMYLVNGLVNTLSLTFFALLLGTFLGILVAVVRVSWDKSGPELHGIGRRALGFANWLCQLYLTIIRGTPVMLQILIMYFVIFASSTNKLMVGSLAFGINSGAYVAEIVRSGIMSVDGGQTEAGRSLGLNYVQTMWYIVIPQAFKNVLPALGNEFIVLLKETAVAGYISMSDLTYGAQTIGGLTYDYLFPLTSAAFIYLTMVMFFTHLVGKLERRMRNSER